jgi:RHS repeat-associated protein
LVAATEKRKRLAQHAGCVEERTAGTATPLRQYVWGNDIDECIQLTTYAAMGPQNLPAGAYYLLQDLLYRAAALTDGTGGIAEAYDTDAYGNTIIFTAADSGGNWFSAGATQSDYGAKEIIFCGYRYDPDTALYYVRNRTYSPALGRWLQRDPLPGASDIRRYRMLPAQRDSDAQESLFTVPAVSGNALLPVLFRVGLQSFARTGGGARPERPRLVLAPHQASAIPMYNYCRNEPTKTADPSGLIDPSRCAAAPKAKAMKCVCPQAQNPNLIHDVCGDIRFVPLDDCATFKGCVVRDLNFYTSTVEQFSYLCILVH